MDQSVFPHLVARRVVEHLQHVLALKPLAVICPSAGRSVEAVYGVLRRDYANALDWGRVICVQMDEYEGVAPQDSRSLCSQLIRELVGPLAIGRLICFNDVDGSLRVPLDAYESRLLALGGIDVAVHGVGVNGHIGFNEPNAPDMYSTRYAQLHESTKLANEVPYDRAFTLGIDALLTARVSIVIAKGLQKRRAIEQLLFGPVDRALPVSLLRRGVSVSVILDDSVRSTACAEDGPVRQPPTGIGR